MSRRNTDAITIHSIFGLDPGQPGIATVTGESVRAFRLL